MISSPRRTHLVPFAAAAAVAVCLAAAPSLRGQGEQDLSGAWQMEMSALLPPDEEQPQLAVAQPQLAPSDCVYAGDCQMDQDGSDLSGTVDLTLVDGPEECPPEMTAALDGTVAGDAVAGTLSGQQGLAEFQGSEGNSFSGTFEGLEGPFAGSTGEWLAERSILAIPALTGTGLTLLVLALLAGGGWMLHRERRRARA